MPPLTGEREVHTWFREPLPALAQLLGEGQGSALNAPALANARQGWARSDAFYFRAIARLQKLWAAGGAWALCALWACCMDLHTL